MIMPDIPSNGNREMIPFSKLILDKKNPRLLGEQPSQQETIRTMLRRHGDEIAELADHIVRNGRDPADLFRIIPELDDSGKDTGSYIVVDGNRRLTAYRVLETPELIPQDLKSSLRKKFVDLSNEFDGPPNNELCVLYPNRQTANPFVELAHRGKLGGAGRSQWSGMAGAYFDKENARQLRPEVDVLELVRASGKLSPKAQEKASSDSFPISTLQRIVEDAGARKHIGLSLDKEGVKTPFPRDEVLKPLVKVVEDLATNKQNSRTLNNAAALEAYAASVARDYAPNETRRSERAVAISELNKPQTEQKPRAKPSPAQVPRTKLVPSEFQLELKSRRLEYLLDQMKKVNINTMPDVGGILLRVFVEWSVEEYIRSHNVPMGKSAKGDRTNRRLLTVVEEMNKRGHATTDQLKAIKNAASNDKSIINMETLHGYVHNPSQIATTLDVRQGWDQLEEFLNLLHASYIRTIQ